MRLFLQKLLVILCFGFILQGCETFKGSDSNTTLDKEYAGWDAVKFHENAKKAMESENYQKSIKLYETLEARYPFGEYAAQAQLDIAYAYYKNSDPEAAIAATDRFIKVNPRHTNVDYAYYLKGLVSFNRSIGFIDRFLPTDTSQRNPSNVKEAYKDFQELIRRFPDSQYAPDAKQRILSLNNNLAMHEIHVAHFYLKRKAYLAAANRAGHVVKEYQQTPAIPHALNIMQEAYAKLGLEDLAADAKRVYQKNFPNGMPVSEQETSFVQKTWDFFGMDQ